MPPNHKVITSTKGPLARCIITLSGRFKGYGHTQPSLEAVIQSIGGKVTKNVAKTTTHIVCTKDSLQARSVKVATGRSKQLLLVSPDWVLESEKQNRLVDAKKYIWGEYPIDSLKDGESDSHEEAADDSHGECKARNATDNCASMTYKPIAPKGACSLALGTDKGENENSEERVSGCRTLDKAIYIWDGTGHEKTLPKLKESLVWPRAVKYLLLGHKKRYYAKEDKYVTKLSENQGARRRGNNGKSKPISSSGMEWPNESPLKFLFEQKDFQGLTKSSGYEAKFVLIPCCVSGVRGRLHLSSNKCLCCLKVLTIISRHRLADATAETGSSNGRHSLSLSKSMRQTPPAGTQCCLLVEDREFLNGLYGMGKTIRRAGVGHKSIASMHSPEFCLAMIQIKEMVPEALALGYTFEESLYREDVLATPSQYHGSAISSGCVVLLCGTHLNRAMQELAAVKYRAGSEVEVRDRKKTFQCGRVGLKY